MKKFDAGQVIMILANLGVIAGIAFLAFEIRQNTQAVQASTLQDMLNLSTTFLVDISLDQETSALWQLAQEDHDQLDDLGKFRIQRLYRSLLQNYQGAYLQYTEGSLSEEGWEVFRVFACPDDGAPEAEDFVWPQERQYLTKEFADFYEGPDCRPRLKDVQ